MDNFRSVGSRNDSRIARRSLGEESQAYSTMTGFTTGQSDYTMKSMQTSAYQTDGGMSEAPSNILGFPGGRGQPEGTVKLMPVKIKDLMQELQNNPAYKDKAPMIINMKQNDINQLIEKGRNGSLKGSPRTSLRQSPVSLLQPGNENMSLRTQLGSPPYYPDDHVSGHSSRNKAGPSRPPLGEQQAPQVYAMTDIQAYPMIGGNQFRANKSQVRRKKGKRPKSRAKSPGRRVRRKKRSRSRKRSRPRSRPKSRARSRRPRSRPRKVVRVPRRPRRKSPPIVVVRGGRSPQCCTNYPMCDLDCAPGIVGSCPPRLIMSRGGMVPSRDNNPSRMSTAYPCNCVMCQEKLQFVQPSICSKKRNFWTNEYAILPKPQINLIDPCTELDPSIYPRADNPCIRDGRGNPLTDCIGRPLRDPIGKKFLNFSANGSVMDTNFRGNFYTGQPPLCVKCPMPGNTCAPDTTHNWWMSCGYPIRPDMTPYFQKVVARENMIAARKY